MVGLALVSALLVCGATGASAAPAHTADQLSATPLGQLPPLGTSPTPPERDPFYRPPADIAGYRPGDLIRSRTARALIDPRRLVPSHVWQVLYRSTTAAGGPDAVSGTVLVPDAPWTGRGPRPVIAYSFGGQGIADHCAPSYTLGQGTNDELPVIDQALARGWAVAGTDLEGLGTPGVHTVFVQRSEGHAVLDGARAALRLPDARLARDAPIGIWGYSEGGGAVGMAAELAHDYAPDLHAVGVAAGGVVADVRVVTRHYFTLPPYNGFDVAIVDAFAAAYPDLRLDRLITPAGRRTLRTVRGQCSPDALALGSAAPPPAQTFTADPLSYPPLVEKLADNSLGSRAPDMPVLVYHGSTDEILPFSQVRALYQSYCGRGVRTQLVSPPGEHLETGAALSPVAVAWLADRFAGKPAPDTCRTER